MSVFASTWLDNTVTSLKFVGSNPVPTVLDGMAELVEAFGSARLIFNLLTVALPEASRLLAAKSPPNTALPLAVMVATVLLLMPLMMRSPNVADGEAEDEAVRSGIG